MGQGRGPQQAGAGPGGGGRGGRGGQQQPYGFYLPFNWRGFHDFGSGLFGDWGVHIMGAAYWALNLKPEYLLSVERIKAEGTSPFTYPVKNAVRSPAAVAASGQCAASIPGASATWTTFAGASSGPNEP